MVFSAFGCRLLFWVRMNEISRARPRATRTAQTIRITENAYTPWIALYTSVKEATAQSPYFCLVARELFRSVIALASEELTKFCISPRVRREIFRLPMLMANAALGTSTERLI